LTTTSGIGCTAPHSTHVDEIRHHENKACNNGVSDLAQRVVGMRVRRAERPAGSPEPRAEGRAADEREQQELEERQADDARRDRDEGPQERRREPDRHGPVVVPLEARLRSRELRVGDVDVAAVAVDEGTAAEVADPPAEPASDQVPERPCRDEPDVGRRVRVHRRAEDVDGRVGERPARDGARVEHDQLAADGDDGRGDHQQEDRDDAVIGNDRRQRRREPNWAVSSTVPIEFVATTRTP
jgi:hypothetical protein